jgi:hypothetical protein
MDTQNIKTNKGKNFPNRARYDDNQKKIIAVLEKNPAGVTRKQLLKKLGWKEDYYRRVLRNHLHNKKKGLVTHKIVTIKPASECLDRRDHLYLTRDLAKQRVENLKLTEAWLAIAKTVFHRSKEAGLIPVDANSQEDFEKFFSENVMFLFPVVENGKLVDTETVVYPLNRINILALRRTITKI